MINSLIATGPEKTFGQAFYYVVVGSVGCLLDTGLLILFMLSTDYNIMVVRLFTFSLAVSATWYLNKTWTFKARVRAIRNLPQRRYFQYMSVQISGAILNLSIFYLLITQAGNFLALPLVALGIGAIASTISNFLLSKYWVFRIPSEI